MSALKERLTTTDTKVTKDMNLHKAVVYVVSVVVKGLFSVDSFVLFVIKFFILK